MLSIQLLQIAVAVMVASETTIRLSKDICKTRKKQKARMGLLKLNGTIPDIGNTGGIIVTIFLSVILTGIVVKQFSTLFL
jgi:hypothetical protein